MIRISIAKKPDSFVIVQGGTDPGSPLDPHIVMQMVLFNCFLLLFLFVAVLCLVLVLCCKLNCHPDGAMGLS